MLPELPLAGLDVVFDPEVDPPEGLEALLEPDDALGLDVLLGVEEPELEPEPVEGLAALLELPELEEAAELLEEDSPLLSVFSVSADSVSVFFFALCDFDTERTLCSIASRVNCSDNDRVGSGLRQVNLGVINSIACLAVLELVNFLEFAVSIVFDLDVG